MSTLTIHDIDDDVMSRLRIRAAEHGRSMWAEAREILRLALVDSRAEDDVEERGLGTLIHQHFVDIGGVELDIPKRTEEPRYVDFDEFT